jgi:hypothetical protein
MSTIASQQLYQLTREQLLALPEGSPVHARLIRWQAPGMGWGFPLPIEDFDGPATLHIQRESVGGVVFLALQSPNWVIYTPDDITGEGNLYQLTGDLLQMQVYGPDGQGKAYGELDESDARGFRAAVMAARRRQHTEQSEPIQLSPDMKPTRLPTGARVVNVTPLPLQFALDGSKTKVVPPCGYTLRAFERRVTKETRGKSTPVQVLWTQYGVSSRDWQWIHTMQARHGYAVLFVADPFVAQAYAAREDSPVVCPIPNPGEAEVFRMDQFLAFPHGPEGLYFFF